MDPTHTPTQTPTADPTHTPTQTPTGSPTQGQASDSEVAGVKLVGHGMCKASDWQPGTSKNIAIEFRAAECLAKAKTEETCKGTVSVGSSLSTIGNCYCDIQAPCSQIYNADQGHYTGHYKRYTALTTPTPPPTKIPTPNDPAPAPALIDSLAKLQSWCNEGVGNCAVCKGKSTDDGTCKTRSKRMQKCRTFKGSEVCDRIAGCWSTTNKKGKKKCKGKKHGLL
jgi:hypothetical protein